MPTDLGTIVHGDRERFLTAALVEDELVSTLVVRDENGAVVEDASLAGWVLRFTGREESSRGAVLVELDLDHGVEIVDAEDRIVRINLAPDDYEEVPRSQVTVFWDLQGVAPGDPDEVHTLDYGTLEIIPGSTW